MCCYAAVNVAAVSLHNGVNLPSPPGNVKLNNEFNSRDLPVFESTVVTWTRQIKAVLSLDRRQVPNERCMPLAELGYWAKRNVQLTLLLKQLGQPEVMQLQRTLKSTSTACLSFVCLCKDARAAREEAAENTMYLQTLQDSLDKLMNSHEFSELITLFRPILHTLLLIWQHSKYYGTADRLLSLVRDIGNALVEQARKLCNGRCICWQCKFDIVVFGEHLVTPALATGSEVMQMEPQQAADKLRLVLKVLGSFKSYFLLYKGKSMSENPEHPWQVPNEALFGRLDAFLERCHDVLELCNTVQEVRVSLVPRLIACMSIIIKFSAVWTFGACRYWWASR